MRLNYRADLDGLRAIAVLAVVLNHAGIPYFSGGYVGVDIFFVISGFLITTIIAHEINENDFTLSRFYERRVRRIFPALVVMVVFTLLTSALIYDAERFKAFGKSLMSTMLFYSNVNFWKEAGYFDALSLLKPLLHTWSLAVEEQFYIVFPVFMCGINFGARKSVKAVFSVIALISLGVSIYMVSGFNNDPTSAFYLAHMRAWELLAGGLLALNVFPAIANKGINTALGFIGSLVIGISIIQYTENTPFPGFSAILPVLGTALVIYSNMAGNSLVGKVLGVFPLVFIGKISYSLYLWHWPLIIFAKYYLIRPMTSMELSIVLVATFAISTLSWRFIETPFRSKNFLSTRQLFALAGGTMTVILAVAGAVYYFNGFPSRETSASSFVATAEQGNDAVGSEEDFVTYDVGDKSQPASFMVWGDSHASSLHKAVKIVAHNNGLSGVLTYKLGCPPLLGISREYSFGTMPCEEYNERMIQYLAVRPEITTVILSSRWAYYVEGSRYKEGGAGITLMDAFGEMPRGTNNEALVRLGLERTLQTLSEMNRKVVIVSPIPEIGYSVPSANFIAIRTGRDLNEIIAPSWDEYLDRNQKTFVVFNDLQKKYGFQMVDPSEMLCVEDKCRVTLEGIPLYSDDNHLSLFGSELISRVFEPVFESVKQSIK